MKPRFLLSYLFGVMVLVLSSTARVAAVESVGAVSAPGELVLVVVESVKGSSLGPRSYDRIARVFTDVFEARKWPVKIRDERFAANTPEHDTELRIFFNGISRQVPSELTFRAWMILYDHGTQHDFGVVRFDYSPRAGEQMEDALDRVVRGAALVAADKVQPILFPNVRSQ